MNVTTIFILHGLVYAGLLFLVSSGLTLVFGMMNVLNFAHASFYMLAAYFSCSLFISTGNFWLSLTVCPFLLFVIGAVIERFCFAGSIFSGMFMNSFSPSALPSLFQRWSNGFGGRLLFPWE